MDIIKRGGDEAVNLRQYRERARLTQFELAEKCEMSIQTIQRYEKGTREPRASDILKLCEVLQVSEAELLGTGGEQDGLRVTLVMKFTNEEVMCMSKDKEFKISVDGDEIGIFGMGDFPSEAGIEAFLQKVKSAILKGRAAQTFDVSGAV